MEFVDYYKILEISNDATAEVVKKAYRKLARKLHPDLNPNDKAAQKQFQLINEANQVLSDPEKRKKYDKYGKDWQHAEQFEAQHKNERAPFPGYSSDGDSDYSGFFESFFGGASSEARFRGQDYHAELKLELTEVLVSHKKTLLVNGKNIRITIPAGVQNGQVIKIRGYGAAGVRTGPAGDLYITFLIAENPHFVRSGDDLYTNTPIDLYTAVLGGEKTIDTLNGSVKLKVKPETQSGDKVRLKGKGFPRYKKPGEAGDLYITYHVRLPVNLTDKQKELFAEISKLTAT